MSHITTAGVCEWLLVSSSNFNQTAAIQSQNYNLYLTKAAPVDRVLDISMKVSDHKMPQIHIYICIMVIYKSIEGGKNVNTFKKMKNH